MEIFKFKSEYEFRQKFPSGLYRCPSCNSIGNEPKHCKFCDWSADCLIKTMGKGIVVEIDGKQNEIFKPIEIKE